VITTVRSTADGMLMMCSGALASFVKPEICSDDLTASVGVAERAVRWARFLEFHRALTFATKAVDRPARVEFQYCSVS
jgi:hypothetical protein